MESQVEDQKKVFIPINNGKGSIFFQPFLLNDSKIRWLRRIISILLLFIIVVTIVVIIEVVNGVNYESHLRFRMPRTVVVLLDVFTMLLCLFGFSVIHRMHETGLRIFIGLWFCNTISRAGLFSVLSRWENIKNKTPGLLLSIAALFCFVFEVIIIILTWALIRRIGTKRRTFVTQM